MSLKFGDVELIPLKLVLNPSLRVRRPRLDPEVWLNSIIRVMEIFYVYDLFVIVTTAQRSGIPCLR